MIESVLWKPAIRWQVVRILVLRPIQWVSFRRNEVVNKAVAPSRTTITSGGPTPLFFADDSKNRAQRNTVALRDVDYLVEARLHLTDRAGPEESVTKFVEMFRRRLAKGQGYHQPYLGCRECIADVIEPAGDEKAIAHSADLGVMLWDILFNVDGNGTNRPVYFRARLIDGVLHVPPTAEAARATLTS